MNALLENFVDDYARSGIDLDEFQVDACRALAGGRDVLVSAPTGSGKTVVAHFAVDLALARGRRCVYTAPVKALSNQKHAELAARLGEESVGLLTGDLTINRDAPILVVTTEVLRNMLFASAPEIGDIGYVVLDEVHYLADRERGPVWEEVILTLPSHVTLVSLSATIANTQEMAGWLRSVRGRTELIVSDVRPVPLLQHVAVGRRILRLYGKDPDRPSSALVSAISRMDAADGPRLNDRQRRRIIAMLDERAMLPAIEFIFSRKGCDQAVAGLLRNDVTLTTPRQRAAIEKRVATLREQLSESDRRAIRFESCARALVRGYGAHHAGVYPALKELTERLMNDGLLRIVYATGTLALGIDMPVRTVVVESLRRWDGSDFVDLSATEYTQLIGRAGRRGKDDVGHAVVVGNAQLDPHALADLGSGRVDPLISAFVPSYNTVVNLLAEQDYARSRGIMGRSFAQYQRNADLAQTEARLARVRQQIAVEEAALFCDRGDIVEYVRLRSTMGRAAKSARKAATRAYRRTIAESFDRARNGALYAVNLAGELEYVLVLSASRGRLRVINWYGELFWLRVDDLGSQLREVGAVTVPAGRSLKDPATREDLADAIASAVAERDDLGIDRDLLGSWSRSAVRDDGRLQDHACASCPDLEAHLRDAQALASLIERARELTELAGTFSDSVGREFDATADVLRQLGLLQGREDEVGLGPGARILRSLHLENDLVAYLCLSSLREGELGPAQFAGWASMFLGDDRLAGGWPRDEDLARLAGAAEREVDFLRDLESRHGIERTREITPRCMDVFARWAAGASMEECLRSSRMQAGDFINAARRLVDLLGQFAVAGQDNWIADVAMRARASVRRSEVM
ncbi:MAG: DEAD/DEAH box helicase [Actinomycetaceae bacterium]|nr:DEAD/DEAH box helicase [Actinomycetaceae bacterium]